jgi:hypothetical protein
LMSPVQSLGMNRGKPIKNLYETEDRDTM